MPHLSTNHIPIVELIGLAILDRICNIQKEDDLLQCPNLNKLFLVGTYASNSRIECNIGTKRWGPKLLMQSFTLKP